MGQHMTFEEFQSEYYDLAHNIQIANHKQFAMYLRDWLAFLDGEDWSRSRLSQLNDLIDFDAWWSSTSQTGVGLAGGGTIEWAADRTERLSQQLGVFRWLAADDGAYVNFAMTFAYAGSRLDDMIAKINTDYFASFSRELLKDLRRYYAVSSANFVPASDRIVAIDHNQPAFRDVVHGLQAIEKIARASNDLASNDVDERDRVVAELQAAQRVIQENRVRVGVVQTLVVPTLLWLRANLPPAILGTLVTVVLAGLAAIFGISLPGL